MILAGHASPTRPAVGAPGADRRGGLPSPRATRPGVWGRAPGARREALVVGSLVAENVDPTRVLSEAQALRDPQTISRPRP